MVCAPAAGGLYHHSLDEYGGQPPDLHQYGAFIFPWYISEELLVPEAVLASWRIGSVSDDPLRVLESILSEDVVAETLAQHAARSLTWDYARGADFRAHVEGWAPHMGESDHRFTALIPHTEPDTCPRGPPAEGRWLCCHADSSRGRSRQRTSPSCLGG